MPASGFLGRFDRLSDRVREEIAAGEQAGHLASQQAQALLGRLLFLYFVQKKGLLDGSPDYFHHRFLDGHAGRPDDTSFDREVLRPLFLAVGDRGANRALAGSVGAVPFLGRGFLDHPAPPPGLAVTNRTFQVLFDELFERCDWVLDDEAPAGAAEAIGPEILGQVFERLVLEQAPGPGGGRRRATGSYYTPRPVVAFMVREALAEYLAGESGLRRATIARLLDLPTPDRLGEEGRGWLSASLATEEARALKQAILELRACDPAAGAGAFLVGLLRAMARAVGLLDWRLGGEAVVGRHNYAFGLKRQIVEHCLYGVDLEGRAVEICRQRLWLDLLADYELPAGLPLARAVRQVPALEGLACQVYKGDSLLERSEGAGAGAGGQGFSRWAELAPFREKGGFDLLIGNPPYGAQVPGEDWKRIKARYAGAGRARNVAAAFLALPFDLLHEAGVACQIVPKSLSYSRGWRGSRALLWERGRLLASADASQAFGGVLLEQVVVFYRPAGGSGQRPRSWHLRDGVFVEGHRVPLTVLQRQDAILNHLSAGAAGLLARLLDRGQRLGSLARTVRGASWQSRLLPAGDPRAGVPVLRGRDIRQFALAKDLPALARSPDVEEKRRAMTAPKIVSQNILAHVTRPYDTLIILSAVDRSGAVALDTTNVTTPLPGCPYPVEYLAALLNSSLARWYFYFAVYNRAVRTMHFDAPYVDGFPVAPAPPGQVARICDLVDKLEDRQAARGAGRTVKYFLPGDDPVYDALDEAVLALYAIEGDDVDRVLRRERPSC